MIFNRAKNFLKRNNIMSRNVIAIMETQCISYDEAVKMDKEGLIVQDDWLDFDTGLDVPEVIYIEDLDKL